MRLSTVDICLSIPRETFRTAFAIAMGNNSGWIKEARLSRLDEAGTIARMKDVAARPERLWWEQPSWIEHEFEIRLTYEEANGAVRTVYLTMKNFVTGLESMFDVSSWAFKPTVDEWMLAVIRNAPQ